uniref:substrate-binding periplasmic protein n=1 Tax=Ningiella ruwaisensis TaxID=2364274 RepID=UPI0010A00565|nr:transporter substrate-binding domain-containing protein [Ningiella ruwaisensis]
MKKSVSNLSSRLNGTSGIQGVRKSLVCLILFILSVVFPSQALSENVRLVGNKVETFINDRGQASRLTDLVSAALGEMPHTITATTQAWSGSGLRNGQFDGYIDHYSLNQPKQNYVYSEPYVQVQLHVASTYADAKEISRLDQLYRERVGLETRFANTDLVRSERSVNWARTQDFFGNIEQLAEQRVDYIMADKIMLEEMNKLLISIDQEPLYISEQAIYIVDISLGMRSAFAEANSVIKAFNEGINKLKTDNEFNEIYIPDASAESTLDDALYQGILKRW